MNHCATCVHYNPERPGAGTCRVSPGRYEWQQRAYVWPSVRSTDSCIRYEEAPIVDE